MSYITLYVDGNNNNNLLVSDFSVKFSIIILKNSLFCHVYLIINIINMTEDKNSQINVYVDSIKEEAKQNENLSSHNITNNTDEFNNSLLDLNLNGDNFTEDESRSAPVEILSEFLSTFMSHDYKSALHYCKLILQYEPDNEIVQDFYPLILEKIDLSSSESDEFADNEASSFSTKSESSTEYFSSASAGTENTSACSSLSSDEDDASSKSSE